MIDILQFESLQYHLQFETFLKSLDVIKFLFRFQVNIVHRRGFCHPFYVKHSKVSSLDFFPPLCHQNPLNYAV